MQMYRVKFARKLPNNKVDLGDAVVCAASVDAAADMVSVILGFASRGTEFKVDRVKPSLHQISRREVDRSVSGYNAAVIEDYFTSSATFPNTTEEMIDEFWHEVAAMATIKATGESEAMVKLANGILRHNSGERQKASTKNLDLTCQRVDYRPRRFEEQALYSEKRIFLGGAARPK